MTDKTRIGKGGQGTPEFSVVISFVLLVFLVVLLIVFQKQTDAYQLQVFLDAKKVTQSVADNINMISRNGHGYYRYFSVPDDLYGYTEYNITAAEKFVGIEYGDQTWATPIITNDVTILGLVKGENETNCITNSYGAITINGTCVFQ